MGCGCAEQRECVLCVCVRGGGRGGGGIINMLYVDEMTVGSLELKQ